MQPPRRTLRRFLFQAATLAFIMLASLSLYLIVLKWRGPAVAAITYTTWDEYIPFRPAWVWIYLIPYAIGPLIVGLLSRDTFAWYIRRGLVLVFVTLAIFVVYPTQTVRPPAEGLGESLTARFYRNMVAIDDPPANARQVSERQIHGSRCGEVAPAASAPKPMSASAVNTFGSRTSWA